LKINEISHGGADMEKNDLLAEVNGVMEEEMAVLPIEYRCSFRLDNGFRLEQLLFSHEEYRWLWTYRSLIYNQENSLRVALSNNMMIRVDYKDGVMDSLGIDMDIINHTNRGRKFFFGVDVSPNSRIFLELKYKLAEDGKEWKLSEMRKGSEVITIGETGGDLPVRFIETPFPMSDRFDIDGGHLAIPFLSDEGSIEEIYIPVDIRKHR